MATRTLLDDLYDTAAGAAQYGVGTFARTAATPAQVGRAGVARVADLGRQGIASALGGQLSDPTAVQGAVTAGPVYGLGDQLARGGAAQAGQGLGGIRQRVLSGIGATPAEAAVPPPVAPPAIAPVTQAPAPTPAAATGTPSVLDMDAPDIQIGYPLGDWGRTPAPASSAPAPARQNSFDITNTTAGTRYAPGADLGEATQIPASLQAPQWGAGAQLQPELRPTQRPGGGQVITLQDPNSPLNPTSRNFNPVAARFALRNRQLDTVRANALTDAETRLATTDLAGQYGLQGQMIGGQFGLQERQLANQGQLATTGLAGQYGLQGRQLANEGQLATTDLAGQYTLGAAMAKAQADMQKAQLTAYLDANDPERLLRQRQLDLVQELRDQNASVQDQIGATRAGQPSAPAIAEDSRGPTYGVSPTGRIIPLRTDPRVRAFEENERAYRRTLGQ